MELNVIAILVATVLQFIVGALWYSLLFGKLWGRIHGFDKLSKATQQKMMKQMGPYYGVQFLVTVLSTVVLSVILSMVSAGENVYMIAILLWAGFIVPVQVSAVLFGGTEQKWLAKKVLVQAGSALLCILVAAGALSLFS